MALNEVHKYGHWLTIPVEDADGFYKPGDGYMFGSYPVVIQVIHTAPREELEGYVALPPSSGGNEDGSKVDPALLADPDNTRFASVSFLGVWAFESDADLAIGDEVSITAPTATERSKVAAGTGFGIVTNRGIDGRYHVRIGK